MAFYSPFGHQLILQRTGIYIVLDPANPTNVSTVSSYSKGGKTFGLSQKQVKEFWFEGAEGVSVHACK